MKKLKTGLIRKKVKALKSYGGLEQFMCFINNTLVGFAPNEKVHMENISHSRRIEENFLVLVFLLEQEIVNLHLFL